jgi:hypothetical protein
MSEDSKQFSEQISDFAKSVSNISSKTKITDVGLKMESIVSPDKESAIKRYDYEQYMKTSDIEVNLENEEEIDKKIEDVVNEFLDDLFGR